jgi:DNA-binding winged helix-turn-helix (wHTH) protein/TolB-like protein
MNPPPRDGQGGLRAPRLLFDDFELRLDSGELLRAGSPVKLQPQPAKVLEILASRSGEVISREEIRQLVWGDAFVDFDASLNFSIKEIRRALGDSATSPGFVETIPRRGYRFLKPVKVEPFAEPVSPSLLSPPSPSPRRWSRLGATGVTLVLLLLTFLIGSRLRPAPAHPRLAILPLTCRSQSLADQQVCGGITEALTAELTRQLPHALDVIAPSSALAYSGKSSGEIGRGLKADYLLSGETVLRDQGLELKVRLARIADGKDLWQETFPGELKEAPLLYAQVVRSVGRSLELRLPPPTKGTAAASKASSPAYESYLRGIYLQRHDQYEQAAATLQEAVLLDPGFAPAYSGLALSRLKITPVPPDLGATEAAARRAIELDPDLADAHLALGQILFQHYYDWAGAGRELRMALALNPGSAEAYDTYSLYLAALGRHSEAIASVGRARELDPASMIVGSDYAWYFYLDHRYEEAIRQACITLQLFPLSEKTAPQSSRMGWAGCQVTIFLSAWQLGDRERGLGAAKAITEWAFERKKDAEHLRTLEEFWRLREQRIRDLLPTRPMDPYVRAQNAMLLGERDRALDLLTHQCAPESLWWPFAAVEPIFDPLHSDPRWGQVLDCFKLPGDAPARRALAKR